METQTEVKDEFVSKTLNKMYHLGLDHAIQVVIEKRNHYPAWHELNYHLSDLIEQLKELKQTQ